MEGCVQAVLKIASEQKDKKPISNWELIQKVVETFEVEHKDLQQPVLLNLIEESKDEPTIINQTMELLVEKSLKDWRFSEIAVKLVIGLKEKSDCLYTFLAILQKRCKLFLWSSESGKDPSQDNLGCLALLAYSACYLTLSDDSPIDLLVSKVMPNLEPLCSAFYEDSLAVVAHLMINLRDSLFKLLSVKDLSTLKDSITSHIVHGRGSKELRKNLIEGLETLSISLDVKSL